MSGDAIYRWLKRHANTQFVAWYEPGVGRVVAPLGCADSGWIQVAQGVVIGLLLCLISLSSTASAQVVRVVNEHAQARQVCRDGFCTVQRLRDLGTGVVISCGSDSEPAYVLTAAHVVKSPSRAITVSGPEDQIAHPASIAGIDHAADVALLRVDRAIFSDCAPLCVPSGRPAVTVVGLSGNHPHVQRATLLEASRVNCVMRDGDSGGPVLLDGHCVGLVSAVTENYTRIVPAQTLEHFVSRVCPQCSCKPNIKRPLVPVPVPVDRVPLVSSLAGDVPDAEKAARIRSLESRLAVIEARFSEPSRAATASEAYHRDRGPAGPPGPPGKDGRDGRHAELKPIVVQLDVVDDQGQVLSSDRETFPPGEPIKLRFRAVRVGSRE